MFNLVRTSVILLLFTAVAAYAGTQAQRSSVKVVKTTDLHALGKLSASKGLPILLVFSASHCPYCELLEDEILNPMLISGDYTDKIIIRKVMLDGADDVRDFSGKTISSGDFALRHNVFVTPTMLFFGPNGMELTKRIIGINTVEMFGGDVDSAIDASRAALKKSSRLAGRTGAR